MKNQHHGIQAPQASIGQSTVDVFGLFLASFRLCFRGFFFSENADMSDFKLASALSRHRCHRTS